MIRARIACFSADRALVFSPGSIVRSGMLQFMPCALATLLAFTMPATALAGTASIPTPAGLYAWSSYSNNPAADGSTALPIDLLTNPTFLSDAVAGVAIYVLDATIATALMHKKAVAARRALYCHIYQITDTEGILHQAGFHCWRAADATVKADEM